MITTRRGFLGSILALGVAPAIVRADSLMRIVPRDTVVLPDVESFFQGSVRDWAEFMRRRMEQLDRYEAAAIPFLPGDVMIINGRRWTIGAGHPRA